MDGTGWKETYLGGSPEAEERIFVDLANQVHAVQTLNRDYAHAPRPLRGQHAKIHAGVNNAEFQVSPELPEDLRQGFFQPGRKYPATLRFSNADGLNRPDTELDLRGISVRLSFEDRKPHDFLFVNVPVSHVRNAVEFMIVTTAIARKGMMYRLSGDAGEFVSDLEEVAGKLQTPGSGKPFEWLKDRVNARFEAARMLTVLGAQVIRSAGIKSLVTQDYWARPALQFGQLAVQFRLRPVSRAKLRPEASGPDLLRADLQRRLKAGPIVLQVELQRFVDEETTPIEDASKEWSEDDSPFIPVAQIVIPEQDLSAKAQEAVNAEVDALQFSPWNNIAGDFLRPLGGMNRGRRLAYRASAEFRKQGLAAGSSDRS